MTDIKIRILAESNMPGVAQAATGALRSLGAEAKSATSDLRSIANQLGTVTDQSERMLGTLRKFGHYGALMVGFQGIASLPGQLAAAADAMTTLDSKLRLVEGSSIAVMRAQQQIVAIARETHQPLTAVGDTYFRMAKAGQALNLTQQETVGLTRTITQAIALVPGSAESANAALMQFGQALASGVLRGEELNSVMEQAPGLADALAKGLGVTTGELRRLGVEGELSVAQLVQALRKVAPEIAAQYTTIAPTISGAMQDLSNAFDVYVGRINTATHAGDLFGKSVRFMADNFSVAMPAALAIGTAALLRLRSSIFATKLATDALAVSAKAATTAYAFETVAMSAANIAATGPPIGQAAVQMTNASVAARALGVAFRFIGGWPGLIATALIGGAAAWLEWGNAAKSAGKMAEEAMRKAEEAALKSGRAVLEELQIGVQGLQAQLDTAVRELETAKANTAAVGVQGEEFNPVVDAAIMQVQQLQSALKAAQAALKEAEEHDKNVADSMAKNAGAAGAAVDSWAKTYASLAEKHAAATAELKAMYDERLKLINDNEKKQVENFGLGSEKLTKIIEENDQKRLQLLAEYHAKTGRLDKEYSDRAKKQADETVATEERKRQAIARTIDQLKFNVDQLGRNNRAQEIAIALRNAGANAASKEGREIAALTGKLYDHEQALKAAAEAAAEQERAQTKALAEMQKAADPWAEALGEAIGRVDSAFVDMWKNIGSGFDSFADSLKDAFKQLLAEMAHMAITRPILMKFASALGLGGASGGAGVAGTAASALGGGGSASAAQGIGNLLSLGSAAQKFWTGYKASGTLAGGFGAATGGAAGAGLASGITNMGGSFAPFIEQWGTNAGIFTQTMGAGGMGPPQLSMNWGGVAANVGAGVVGGMAGNYLGSNVLSDGRQAQGSEFTAVGGMVGSWWGPIGTAIGSAIGALADVAFGTDDTKRIRLGITAGQYDQPSNLTESVRGTSGLLLQSEHNRTDDAGAGAKQLMEAFSGIDNALTVAARAMGLTIDFTNTKLVNPRYTDSSAVQDGFFGTALNNEFDAEGLKNASKEFITAWLEQIKDQLPERVRTVMAGAAKKTAEEMLETFGLIGALDKLLRLDVLKDVAETAQEAAQTVLETYGKATQAVVDLAAEYDGSTESLAKLTETLAAQKEVAFALAEAYEQAAEVVKGTFGDTIARIEESQLSDEELYARRQAQFDSMVAELARTTDPEKIAELAQRLDATAGSAWEMLDETQQGVRADEFIVALQRAQELALERIEAGRDSLGDRETATADAVDLELKAAATKQAEAAQRQLDAANLMHESVQDLGRYMRGGFQLA